MLRDEKCLEFVFEGRGRIRLSDILGKVVPDVKTETGERVKAVSFAIKASEFEYACIQTSQPTVKRGGYEPRLL